MRPLLNRHLIVIVLASIGFIAVPGIALAAANTTELVLDFQRTGVLKDLLGRTITVAKSFLFFSAFLAYVLEAFGPSPTVERDFGAVTWRLVVVLFLLWNYQPIFGGVVSLMDRLEVEVAPESTWQAFTAEAVEARRALEGLNQGAGVSQASMAAGSGTVVTWAYEALVGVLQLTGEAVVFLIRWMSRILTATLFILGPLALVASIPRMSRTGARWFLRFVTIASWPVFAGVLLTVMVTLGAQGVARRTYLECLVASLVMLVTSLATPTLASHVVGGALQNFASVGFGTAKGTQRDMVVPAARTIATSVGGLKGHAVAAGAALAGRFGLGGGAGGGGPGGRPGGGARGRGGGMGGTPASNAPGGRGGARGRGGGRGGGRPPPGGGGSAPAAPPRGGPPAGTASNPPMPPPRDPGSFGSGSGEPESGGAGPAGPPGRDRT